MLSCLLIINQRGDLVISRYYRDNITRRSIDHFRSQIIAAKETGSQPPIQYIDGSTFMYMRHENIYLVTATKSNSNPVLAFQFLLQLNRIFQAYFGIKYTEETIKNNFTLVYELLDESMDYGYPQNCSIDNLKLYINLGTIKTLEIRTPAKSKLQLTSQITASVDWRRDGIKYKNNEIYLDIMESVNLTVSSNGTVLRHDVAGTVLLKSLLTGMPECKFGINDKLILEKEKRTAKRTIKRNQQAVELADVTFHRCVQLGKFDNDRTITFIPPDGEFTLMTYRISDHVQLPFKVIPMIKEDGKTRINMNIKISSTFQNRLFATNVIIKIPVPHNTARCKINVPTGKAKFEPEQKAIVWKIARFAGKMEHMLTGDIEILKGIKDKPKSLQPPIELQFRVPMFTASGLYVRFLKVFEKSSYLTTKWVRYVTSAGEYHLRT